jgi:glucokinase
LESRYSVPVFVNNDGNCFVLGEKYFGKAKGCRNVAGMVIGTGLGTGIIANGALYTGGHCGAGEFGVIPFRDKTLEDYVSGSFFRHRSGTPGEIVAERAMAGDAGALELFAEFGRNLGEAVKIVMYAIDPELVVLGGSVSKVFSLFESALRESLADFAYQRAIRDLRIEVSETEQVQLLGAAALCFEYSASSIQR